MDLSEIQQLAIQALISQRVGRDVFDTYFNGMHVDVIEDCVILRVLDEYCARFIRLNFIYREDIEEAVNRVTGCKVVGMLIRDGAIPRTRKNAD